MKKYASAALLLAGLICAPALASALPDPVCPTAIEAEIISLINESRADSGRSVLEVDRRLIVASRHHSQDMDLNGFISHIGSDGSNFNQRAAEAGYSLACGELIGQGFLSAASIVAAWMGSDPHRAILLYASAIHIGAGVQNVSYTVLFGLAAESAVPPECSCCSARVGDANMSGDDEPTIGDVSTMIDARFITGTCAGILGCLPEADINQSGGVSPTCDDITIGDISVLIDYLFITGQSLGLPNCL